MPVLPHSAHRLMWKLGSSTLLAKLAKGLYTSINAGLFPQTACQSSVIQVLSINDVTNKANAYKHRCKFYLTAARNYTNVIAQIKNDSPLQRASQKMSRFRRLWLLRGTYTSKMLFQLISMENNRTPQFSLLQKPSVLLIIHSHGIRLICSLLYATHIYFRLRVFAEREGGDESSSLPSKRHF